MDDIIQGAMTDKEALEQYSLLFERLVKVGIQVKPSKCIFFAREIEILGHHITQEGRTPISKEVEAISSMPAPAKISAVKHFLRLCRYFRDFIPCMLTRTQTLQSLLKKGLSFRWTEETAREFQDLKQAITGPDVMLFHPDWNAPMNYKWMLASLEAEQCWLKRRMVYFVPSDLHPEHLHQLNHVGQLCTRNSLQ